MAIGTGFDIEPDRFDESGDVVSVKVTREQLEALMNTINWNVDMDTVAIDNGDADRADFLQAFADKARHYI